MKYIDSFKATQIGLYLVIFSALLFVTIGVLIGVYFFKIHELHIAFIPFVIIPISLFIYWPFWSLLLAKWKIWSFKRIDDIEILVKIAERKNLIYPDNHFYTKYEFCSKKDKYLIRKLKKTKLAEDNTDILNNQYKDKEFKVKSYFDILFNNKSLLEISRDGLKIRGIGLIKWDNFSYLNLDFDKSIKTKGFREIWIDFKIKKDNETYRFDLGEVSFLNINYFKLEYLLDIYKKLDTKMCKNNSLIQKK